MTSPHHAGSNRASAERFFHQCLPRKISDHELVRPIAEGSYGEVWLCRNAITGQFRAVKLIWRDAFDDLKPYNREFEAIQRFEPVSRKHAGFVHILHTGSLEKGFYYIMELADDSHYGKNIKPEEYSPATLEAKKGRLTLEEMINIGTKLADALSILHSEGLLHRDVKPANVIFVGGEAKLADIGLVTAVTEAHSLVGTRGFMAPEGPTSPQGDIYALGKVVYEITSGRDRFDFPLLPLTPEGADRVLILELNEVLLKACQPLASKRHRSAEEFGDELRLLHQGKSIRRVRHLEHALAMTKRSFGGMVLSMVAVFLLIEWFQLRREALRREQEQQISAEIGRGNEKIAQGDYMGALDLFTHAAIIRGQATLEDKVRIGVTAEYAPKTNELRRSDSEVAALSPDGIWLATAGAGGTDIYQCSTKERLHFEVSPSFLAFDSNVAIGIAASNVVVLIPLNQGEPDKVEYPDEVRYIGFDQSHTALVTTKSGRVFQGAREIRELEITNLYKAIPSPSGQYIALTCSDGEVVVKRSSDWVEQLRIQAHNLTVYAAVFSSDEHRLFTTGFDRNARCWDMETGKQLGLSMPHDDGVTYVAESPGGLLVATASYDRTVKLWQGGQYSPRAANHILYHSEPVLWCKFLDESHVVSHCFDGTTWLWAITPQSDMCREVPRRIPIPNKLNAETSTIHCRAEGNAVVGTMNGRKIALTFPWCVSAIASHPTKPLLAVGTSDGTHAHHSVKVFDEWGRLSGGPLEHSDGILHIVFSQNGELLVTSSEDFTSCIWDAGTWKRIAKLPHNHQVQWAAFNSSDQWVVTGSFDQTLRIWDARTGVPITPPVQVGNLVEYVKFCSPGEIEAANRKRAYWIRLPMGLISSHGK